MLPEQVRSLAANPGSWQIPLAASRLVAWSLHLFVLPFKQEPVFGTTSNTLFDKKFFAFDGELIYNPGSLVKMSKNIFHQTTN